MSTPELNDSKTPSPADAQARPAKTGTEAGDVPHSVAGAPTRLAARGRKLWLWVAGGVGLGVAALVGVPWVLTALRTVSTDDAYVNGHVTFVAPARLRPGLDRAGR